jgi:hypothetical protein
MEASSLRFAAAARSLGDAARRRGLVVPGFRSPPRHPVAQRTVRRHREGMATVSVQYRDRPWNAVLADLIEGVVVVNELHGPSADQARSALWAALEVAERSSPPSVEAA